MSVATLDPPFNHSTTLESTSIAWMVSVFQKKYLDLPVLWDMLWECQTWSCVLTMPLGYS
jgi:hypothetical protein